MPPLLIKAVAGFTVNIPQVKTDERPFWLEARSLTLILSYPGLICVYI